MTTTREPTQTTLAAASTVEEVEFHRASRAAARPRWWRPLLVGLVAAGLYVTTTGLLFLAIAVAGIASPRFERVVNAALAAEDLGDPVFFVFGMILIILLMPAVQWATKLFGRRPIGTLSSVLGRLRWRWLARCGVVALAIYSASYAASFAVDTAQGESFDLAPDVPRIMLMLALTFALVPFQCAAEEYVFRGYLMQAVGHYLRHPAFAILLPLPLFVIGHDYNWIGQVDVAVFATAAGWLTWRTGGLEAAIALHVVNNVSGFVLGAFGLVDVNATDQSPLGLLASVVITLVFVAIVVPMATKHSIQRSRLHVRSIVLDAPGAEERVA